MQPVGEPADLRLMRPQCDREISCQLQVKTSDEPGSETVSEEDHHWIRSCDMGFDEFGTGIVSAIIKRGKGCSGAVAADHYTGQEPFTGINQRTG